MKSTPNCTFSHQKFSQPWFPTARGLVDDGAATGVELGINEFADLTHREFKNFYLGYIPAAQRQVASP